MTVKHPKMFKRLDLRKNWLMFQVLIWSTIIFLLYISSKQTPESNYLRSHSVAPIDPKQNEIFEKFELKRKLDEWDQSKQLEIFKSAKIIDENNLKFFQMVQREKYKVKCNNLFEWDEEEIRKTKRELFRVKSQAVNDESVPLLQDENFIFDKSMCNYYKSIRGFNKFPISDFEYNFPIAFSILTYEHVEQFERMLRLIYRSHNVYCIQ